MTAALELKRRGIDVVVVDKRATASGASRAVGILPRSLDLLAASGARDKLLAEGVHYEGVRLHRRAKELAHFSFEKVGAGLFILGLAQDRTETVLRDCLASYGGEVRYSTEFVNYVEADGGIVAEFADGTHATFDYLLGADGVRSTVRERAGLAYRGIELPEQWSIADIETRNWKNSDGFSVYLLDEGIVCVVAPMAPDRMRIIANRPDARNVLPVPIEVTKVHREGSFTISVRQVDEYRKGRLFLAGDAAHCHSPVGGRGMNLGIEDACEFALRLVEGRLDDYSRSRHAVGKKVIGISEAGRKVLAVDAPFKRGLAAMLLTLAGKVPFMERAFLKRALNL